MQLILFLLKILIKGYRLLISPFLTPSCRFQPTCSEYALDGLKENGIKAIPLIIKRILRCHPLGKSGFDPYPQTSHSNSYSNSNQKAVLNHQSQSK